jgi:SAM-dependent methyltransferase
MKQLLYDELVPFYHLLDPLEDHADEGEAYGSLLLDAAPEATSLLELGSGAGHGAYYLKGRFGEVTLSDLSPAMLARSAQLNPGCRHLQGDMREMRLGQRFDCVLIHDAISYITSSAELLATAETVAAHLALGGAALLIPDCTKESFREWHEDHAGDDDERSLRCLSWSTDPDPEDETHLTDFAFLLREGDGEVRAVHDRHVYGLFDQRTWIETLERAGLAVTPVIRPLPEGLEQSCYTDTMFLCRHRG